MAHPHRIADYLTRPCASNRLWHKTAIKPCCAKETVSRSFHFPQPSSIKLTGISLPIRQVPCMPTSLSLLIAETSALNKVEIIMWKEFSKDPDGLVFWGCLVGGLILVAVNMVFSR